MNQASDTFGSGYCSTKKKNQVISEPKFPDFNPINLKHSPTRIYIIFVVNLELSFALGNPALGNLRHLNDIIVLINFEITVMNQKMIQTRSLGTIATLNVKRTLIILAKLTQILYENNLVQSNHNNNKKIKTNQVITSKQIFSPFHFIVYIKPEYLSIRTYQQAFIAWAIFPHTIIQEIFCFHTVHLHSATNIWIVV